MDINSLNTKNTNINLHNKIYILFVHNRKKDKEFNVRISIEIHPYILVSLVVKVNIVTPQVLPWL
jgi:hypothetical protein